MTTHIERALPKTLSGLTAAAVIGALVFAALAFGAVEPWAYSVLAVLAYAALAAAVVRALITRTVPGLLTLMLVPAGLALALVILQYVQWPAGLLETVSPTTVALVRKSASAPGEAGGTISPSLYPHATRDALICLSAYVALFVAVSGYVRGHKQVTLIAGAIVALGFAVSLFAIIQSLSGTTDLYWWRTPAHGGLRRGGSFVSRNQFAAYAGLCLFTGLGLLIARGARAAGSGRRWWENVGRAAARRSHQNFLVGFAVSVMGAAVLWSLSRGGIVSLFLAFAGLALALRMAGFVRARSLYVAATVLVILGWVTYLGWEPVVDRLSTLGKVIEEPTDDWRWRMCADAGRIGSAFPALGTGAGTFLSIYPHYRTLPTYAVTESPHNEYAHVLAETGLTGLAVLFVAMAFLYVRVLRGLVVRRNPYACGLLAGGFAALLAITLHSLVDFPMRSPAIAATVAVLAALLYRAAGIESNGKNDKLFGTAPGDQHQPGTPRGGHDHTTGVNLDRAPAAILVVGIPPLRGGHDHTTRVSLGRAAATILVVGILWLFASNAALDPLRGQLEANAIARAERRLTPTTNNVMAFVSASERGIREHSPDDARLHAKLADFAWGALAWIPDPLERIQLAERAIEIRAAAARLEPLNAEHPFQMAMHYVSFGRTDLAVAQADLACDLVPNDPWIRAYLADGFLTYKQRDLAERYLDRAEQLAAARGIKEAEGAIAAVRRKLEPPDGPK